MVTKAGSYRRIAKGLFFLGLLALFFAVEIAPPLHSPQSTKKHRVGSLRKYPDIQATLPAVAEAGDENDAYSDWGCLLGPFLGDYDPKDTTFSTEREDPCCANYGDFSLPISRSPPVPIPGQ